MRLPYALAQTEAFLDRDLYSMFRKVLRSNGGRVPRLKAGARERCGELKRCKPPLEVGRRPSSPDRLRGLETSSTVTVERASDTRRRAVTPFYI
jgi:hypothetical protein